MAELFQIGEVARMFHLSVSSLRHYEKAGLLTPERVDPDSGYRYYSVRQFEVINTIRYLRTLDLPLSEIADFLQNRDLDNIEEKLLQQRAAVAEKERQLYLIKRKIDNRLRQLTDARNIPTDVIRMIHQPASRIVWIRDSLKIKSWQDMELPIRKLEQSQQEALVFLGKVGLGISAENLIKKQFGKYDGIFLILDEEDAVSGNVLSFPEADCVSIRFRGGHAEAPDIYRRLMDYIHQNSLTPIGFSREITMIDRGLTSDPEKFVTEISIPIQKS